MSPHPFRARTLTDCFRACSHRRVILYGLRPTANCSSPAEIEAGACGKLRGVVVVMASKRTQIDLGRRDTTQMGPEASTNRHLRLLNRSVFG
jgi:hypothetical protein